MSPISHPIQQYGECKKPKWHVKCSHNLDVLSVNLFLDHLLFLHMPYFISICIIMFRIVTKERLLNRERNFLLDAHFTSRHLTSNRLKMSITDGCIRNVCQGSVI